CPRLSDWYQRTSSQPVLPRLSNGKVSYSRTLGNLQGDASRSVELGDATGAGAAHIRGAGGRHQGAGRLRLLPEYRVPVELRGAEVPVLGWELQRLRTGELPYRGGPAHPKRAGERRQEPLCLHGPTAASEVHHPQLRLHVLAAVQGVQDGTARLAQRRGHRWAGGELQGRLGYRAHSQSEAVD